MSVQCAIDHWARNLQAVMLEMPGGPGRVIVVAEATSTQDEAKARGPRIGDVVVAWRQAHGRGRFGRAWADTGEDGVAMTVVVAAECAERLAIAAGVAIARAIESLPLTNGTRVGIKWPNDVMVNDRKLAGVLVECSCGCALIGIGVNVSQNYWPEELGDVAISLAQVGVKTDRIAVMVDILLQLQMTIGMSDEWLEKEFRKRDTLLGKRAVFRTGEREIRGKVLSVDPMRGLAVETEHGERWLPAATTTVLKE